jgi:hypothetical protein
MKPKRKPVKAIGWTALITKSGVDFLITVNAPTRAKAINEIKWLTDVPITMPRQVQRAAVVHVEDAPKRLGVWDWKEE